MKLFHLSDLHIGLKLVSRDLREDQEYIFEQISKRAKEEKPDVIIIAGDVYDKAVPSAEACELFDYFINLLKGAVPDAKIMMISGNHDSAPRVNTYRSILSKQNIYMIGNPPMREDEYMEKVVLEDEFGRVNFYLLPFVKPTMVKSIVGVDENGNNLSYDETIHKMVERENIDTNERNVFVSHQFYLPVNKTASEIERMDSEICTVGNIDQVSGDVLSIFDYAALGHIHKPMKVGSEYYRYCGTPLACSVSESGQEKGIIMVELAEKGNVTTKVVPLVPLRKVRIIKGTLDEVLKQSSDDYVSVRLTDKVDLDVMEMNERLNYAFPNLLNIQRENSRTLYYNREINENKEVDAFELCKIMLGEMDEEETELLKDVISGLML